jgi:hypothetical protein
MASQLIDCAPHLRRVKSFAHPSCPKAMNPSRSTAQQRIEESILLIRGQKVLLDRALAVLYGVTTFNLNKAVKRNMERFPADFMFQLTAAEAEDLRFHFGISSSAHGGRRYLPYAFTEQGVAMLSGVLHSPRAVQVNVAIMRAFVRLREALLSHKDLADKLAELERKIAGHDASIQSLFEAIRQLMAPLTDPPRKEIGFHVKEGPANHRVKKRASAPLRFPRAKRANAASPA